MVQRPVASVVLAALDLDRKDAPLPLEDEVDLAVLRRVVVAWGEAVRRQLLRNEVLEDRAEVDVRLAVQETSFMNSLKKLGLRASVSGTFASSTQ